MPVSLSHNSTNKIYWALATLAAICFSASFFTKQAALFYIPFGVLAVLFVLFYDIKALFFLLIFFLPLSIEFSVTETLSTDLPDEILMAGLTGCIILYMIYKPVIVKNFTRHPLVQLIFLQLIWIAITAAFSHNITVSVKYFVAKTWYVLAFIFGACMLIKNKRDWLILGLCISVPMLLVAAYTMSNHAAEGFSFIKVNDVMKPFFRNHVNYSAMLVCIIPVLLLFHKFSEDTAKKWWKAVIIFSLIAAVFAYSRGAWLALLAAPAAVYFIKRKLIKQALAGAVTGALLTVVLLVYNDNYLKFAPNFNQTIFHKNFGEHMVATVELSDVSTAERFYRWIAGVKMSREELLKGYGPNNFYTHYKRFADPRFQTWVSDNIDHSSVHNYFLLMLIEQGIPGLVIFCVILFAAFLYVQKLYHRVKDGFYKEIILAVGAILTMITVVNMLSDLIETDKIGSLFFLCTGLLVVIDLQTREDNKNLTPSA